MRRLVMALAMVASPAMAAPPCVTAPEAESLVLALAPDLLRSAGLICANALPAGALLRRQDGPLLDRYEIASEQAWPRAQGALRKLAGPEGEGLLESMLARPLLAGLVAPLITGGIRPADCAPLNRMVGLLAPLPPRDTAAVLIAAYQLAPEERRGGGREPPFAICRAPSR